MTDKFNEYYLKDLDNRLRELHKELESDLAKYRDSGYLIKRKR